MELKFPDWEEPLDEEELDAMIAAAAVSTKRRRRHGDDNGQISHATEDNSANGGGAGMIRRCKSRRLPNWAASPPAAASPFSSSSGNGPSGRIGTPVGVAGRPGSMNIGGNGLWRSLSPCRQVNMKVQYPLMSFGGRVVYGRTVREVEKATGELLEIIRAKKVGTDRIPMGFDIEWKPMFRRGQVPNKAAVMQICVDTGHCFVMHIFHSGIPPILQSLLEDSSYVKVGVSIANDAHKIFNDYSIHVEALDDLSGFANRKLGGAPKQWSLSALTETLTCKQLAKPKRIRLGNWEVNALSKEQLHYAATDAFVSWYLYEVLKSFPDATAEDKNVDKLSVHPS